MNIARSSTDVLCAQFCQNNHRECRALSQNQAHVRAHCGAQTDATMKISMCARVMIFFQPLLLVNFVFDRNEAYTAKSCLRCTRKSVSEFNLRYLNSIPKRAVTRLGLDIKDRVWKFETVFRESREAASLPERGIWNAGDRGNTRLSNCYHSERSWKCHRNSPQSSARASVREDIGSKKERAPWYNYTKTRCMG